MVGTFHFQPMGGTGTPLICKPPQEENITETYLAGIHSFGTGANLPTYQPMVFSYVQHYRSWLDLSIEGVRKVHATLMYINFN